MITYDDYDIDPDAQVTKAPEKAPEAEKKAEKPEKADNDVVTYESKEAANSVTKAVQEAASTVRNFVVKIINKTQDTRSTKAEELKVTLDKVKIDAGGRAENALTVSGDSYNWTADVKLELKGNNELIGGSGWKRTQTSSDGSKTYYAADGLNFTDLYGDLTIESKDEKEQGSLTAKGGSVDHINDQNKKYYYAGSGISNEHTDHMSSKNVTISNAKIDAKGGDVTIRGTDAWQIIGGQGMGIRSNVTITDSVVRATGGKAQGNANTCDGGDGINVSGLNAAKSTIFASGGNAVSEAKTTLQGGGGYPAVGGIGVYSYRSNITKSTITARGGDAESVSNGSYSFTYGGNGWHNGGSNDAPGVWETSDVTAVGGNAKTSGQTNGSHYVYGGAGLFMGSYQGRIEVKSGTVTAVSGKTEKDSDFVTECKTSGIVSEDTRNELKASGDATVNSYTPASADEVKDLVLDQNRRTDYIGTITTEGSGRINGYTDAQVIENPDGTYTVVSANKKADGGEIKQEYDYTDAENEMHHFVLKENKAATCTEAGKLTYVCKDHGETETETNGAALDHDYTVTTVAPTCGAEGYDEHICSRDSSHTYRDNYTPATGSHTWGDWNDNHDGTRTHTCTVCGQSETETMPETALELRVVDADGLNVPFTVSQEGSVRTYTGNYDVATLTGSLATLKYLQEHGAETIVFVTNQHTSTFNINDVLAQGTDGANLYLTHTGAEAQLLVVE